MQSDELAKCIETELDSRKGMHITTLDVRDKTTITDYMIVVTATSTRHAKSLCDNVLEKLKEYDIKPLGVEGGGGSDWMLVDLGDVIVHVMTGLTREYYQLEKLWSVPAGFENSKSIS
ncbi:MAG: ribosome silencing factor [Methylomonas sp.]|jgi:ribosome-associated protein